MCKNRGRVECFIKKVYILKRFSATHISHNNRYFYFIVMKIKFLKSNSKFFHFNFP